MELKLVALVFFMLFCASGGIGLIVQETSVNVFPVPLSVRVGRWVEMICSMVFYGLEFLGLIRLKESASEHGVDNKDFISGVYLFVGGLTGHSVLYLMFN